MNNERASAVKIFRKFVGALGWIAIVVQLVTTLTVPTGPDALTRIVSYFSFFTILSNILVATTLTVSSLTGRSRAGRIFLRYELRTALAVYMIITCGIYATLLAGLSPLTEVQYLADVVLHYVIPPLYLVDWMLIRPEFRIDWKNVFYFLIFPLLYGVYTLVRGAMTGLYPYPFVDVTKLGYPAVLITFGLFVLLFLGVSVIMVAVGRWRAPWPEIKRPERRRSHILPPQPSP